MWIYELWFIWCLEYVYFPPIVECWCPLLMMLINVILGKNISHLCDITDRYCSLVASFSSSFLNEWKFVYVFLRVFFNDFLFFIEQRKSSFFSILSRKKNQLFVGEILEFARCDDSLSSLVTHYSKSQIFVQKFNFDKTPTFSRVFHPYFFWQFFSWNQSCQQLKSPKP